MIYQSFKKRSDWVKVWSGRWSFHSDINFGYHWTVMNKIAGKPAYPRIIYIYQNGITDCWVADKDKADLGQRLVAAYHDIKSVKRLAASLKTHAATVFNFIRTHDPKNISIADYRKFWRIAGEYYLPHLSVKYIVDYFSATQLKKFLPVLEDARLFSEPVFRDIENFMEAIAAGIAKRSGYSREQILTATIEELMTYFSKKRLPSKKVLSSRYEKSVILFERGRYEMYAGRRADKVETILAAKQASKTIKGSIAYKGRATGVVRIVIDPFKDSTSFKKGEILVTGMTRPEFLPIMKKAAAFITDAGGILSHAAIVARELKKPCIIGTHVATRVLKTGDLVEVDADKGIVKIL